MLKPKTFTQKTVDESKQEMTEMHRNIAEMDQKYEQVMQKLTASKRENDMLKEKILKLESYGRRENLIFSGIQEEQNESGIILYKKITDVFVNKLGIAHGATIEYQRCHRLGWKARNEQNKPRDVIVRFVKFQDRQLVWENRKLLKNTTIYVKEDFPDEIVQRRSQLYQILQAARSQNKKATLVSDRLIIESKSYTIDTLHTLPAELHPETLAVRELDNTILFYGKYAFLSNFHDAEFITDGNKFGCTEQYYQYNKAKMLGEDEIAQKILETSDPLVQHRLGKHTKRNETKWNNDVAKLVMEEGIKAKFEQNKHLKNALIATGNKMLIQCNQYDRLWSNGLKLNHKDAPDRTKWVGENVLGEILVAIRESVK
jgi:ribA/ribD-fused uncharacterized protein